MTRIAVRKESDGRAGRKLALREQKTSQVHRGSA